MTAPERGPTQNTHWSSHLPATAAAPKERAGLMLQMHAHNASECAEQTDTCVLEVGGSGLFILLSRTPQGVMCQKGSAVKQFPGMGGSQWRIFKPAAVKGDGHQVA